MKQIELTTKLVLAIIGLTSASAILVPTYAVPAIKSADIVDETIQSVDIKNGEVKTTDLADNSVTSAKIVNGEVKTEDLASGAVKPTTPQSVGASHAIVLQPGERGTVEAECPPGTVLTGGGFNTGGDVINVLASDPSPLDDNTWGALGKNVGTSVGTLAAIAMCMGPSP